MKKFAFLVGVFATLVLPASAAGEKSSPNSAVFQALGHCGDPCTIRNNGGGRIVDFEDAAFAIRRGARSALVIDGYCGSACLVMADLARPRTCITSRAVFGYHKTNYNRPLPLRGDLRQWINRNGGFPEFHGRPGLISANVARRFWPMCSSVVAGR